MHFCTQAGEHLYAPWLSYASCVRPAPVWNDYSAGHTNAILSVSRIWFPCIVLSCRISEQLCLKSKVPASDAPTFVRKTEERCRGLHTLVYCFVWSNIKSKQQRICFSKEFPPTLSCESNCLCFKLWSKQDLTFSGLQTQAQRASLHLRRKRGYVENIWCNNV